MDSPAGRTPSGMVSQPGPAGAAGLAGRRPADTRRGDATGSELLAKFSGARRAGWGRRRPRGLAAARMAPRGGRAGEN